MALQLTGADEQSRLVPLGLVSLLGRDYASIPEIFERRAELTPDSTFLIWEGNNWSYRESLDVIQGFAGFLGRMAGTSDPPRVAAYLGNCPEAMWAWLGTCFAGGVHVPLNRHHKGALLAEMLGRSRATLLVTEQAALQELPDLEALGFKMLLLVDAMPEQSRLPMQHFSNAFDPGAYSSATLAPSDPACVLYTSGTTGRSKAVLVPQNQYCRGAGHLVDNFGLREDDVFHNWLPLYHLGGQLHMTMTAVICGGAVALFPTFSVSRFWSEVHGTGASVLCGFEAILRFIWSLPEQEADAESSLRIGIFAGIPPDLKELFEKRFGIRLGENYGMTEADPITHPYPEVDPPAASCGLPGRDFSVSILDSDGAPVPPGSLGEIAARPLAPGVMALDYEDDSRAFQRALRGGWFHTGDLGTMDEAGFLYFKGRLSNHIRRRGENVSAAEVESALVSHEAVLECAALAVASEVGEDEIKVVVVLEPGQALTPSELHRFAAERMASFMVPRYIQVVKALPRGELGKVSLSELTDLGAHVWDAQDERSRRRILPR